MPANQNSTSLKVSSFTDAVQPLVKFLKEKYATDPLVISDVWDKPNEIKPNLNLPPEDESRQYIDLVQEGGGVHGIALAGFTYILEKNGISFLKMAGTSAGAINTMLLSTVYNLREAKILGIENTEKYYETRSEKLLEYLAEKNLSDLVDGHPKWRKVLLELFSGEVNFMALKKFLGRIKRNGLYILCSVVLLLISSVVYVFAKQDTTVAQVSRVLVIVSATALIITILFLYLKYLFLRTLWRVSEKLGINKGKDFEDWIKGKMDKNGVTSVDALAQKFAKEEEALGYYYRSPRKKKTLSPFESGIPASEDGFAESEIAGKIKDPEISIATIKENLSRSASPKSTEFESDNEIPDESTLLGAFADRTNNFLDRKGIHKEIVLVSADIANEMKVEFPAMHDLYWGDDKTISPARYVRMSMSIPFFFAPIRILFDKKKQDYIYKAWQESTGSKKLFEEGKDTGFFVDGGLLSNFPVNVFYNPEIPLPSRPTIGVRLQYEDDSAPDNIKSELGLIGSLVSTMRFFYDREFIRKHKMFRRTVRSIDTGSIHWLNFNMSDNEKIELFFRGALAATIFLAGLKKDETDTQKLLALGEKIPAPTGHFSIFCKKNTFKSEDLLEEGINFDWEDYKRARIKDALDDNPQLLKDKAMLLR